MNHRSSHLLFGHSALSPPHRAFLEPTLTCATTVPHQGWFRVLKKERVNNVSTNNYTPSACMFTFWTANLFNVHRCSWSIYQDSINTCILLPFNLQASNLDLTGISSAWWDHDRSNQVVPLSQIVHFFGQQKGHIHRLIHSLPPTKKHLYLPCGWVIFF